MMELCGASQITKQRSAKRFFASTTYIAEEQPCYTLVHKWGNTTGFLKHSRYVT